MAKRNYLFQIDTTLITKTCCNCGVLFAMEQGYQQQKRRDGESFHCPNGHGQHYTETDKTKLQKANKKLAQLQICCDDYISEANHQERRYWGLLGHVAKVKKGQKEVIKSADV